MTGNLFIGIKNIILNFYVLRIVNYFQTVDAVTKRLITSYFVKII